jgi:ubiquinone/menaquinone biosynthesis C-methylase UbiE
MDKQKDELKRMWGTRREIVLTENVLSYLPKKSNVLDVGCGDGFLVYLLTKKGVKAVGIDISSYRIRYAHEKCPNADFLIADGRYLPFRNEEFGSVTCCEVLEHVPDYHLIINEIFRVIRENGKLLVTVPYLMRVHINYFNEQKISSALESGGFAIKKIYGIGFELEGIGKIFPSKLRILLHKLFYRIFKRANFLLIVSQKC